MSPRSASLIATTTLPPFHTNGAPLTAAQEVSQDPSQTMVSDRMKDCRNGFDDENQLSLLGFVDKVAALDAFRKRHDAVLRV